MSQEKNALIATAAVALLLAVFALWRSADAAKQPAETLAVPDGMIGPFKGAICGGWRIGKDRIAVQADPDLAIRIYDVRDKSKPALVKSLPCPALPFMAVAVTESRLAWANIEAFEIADASNGKVLFKFPYKFENGECSAVARCEPKALVAWIEESERTYGESPDPGDVLVRAADCMTGELVLDKKVRRLESHQTFNHLAVAPDGSSLVFANDTSGVFSRIAIDLKSKDLLWNSRIEITNTVGGDIPNTLVYHPDGKSFYSDRGLVNRIDVLTGKDISKWGPVTYKGHGAIDKKVIDRRLITGNAELLAMDVSPDGKYVAVDTNGICGTVVFDVATGKEFKRIRTTQWPVEQPLFFSADSKGIWVAGTQDKVLKYFKIVP